MARPSTAATKAASVPSEEPTVRSVADASERVLASPRSVGRRPRGAFVGRGEELAALVDALPGRHGSRARLWLVTGEAGIGKTRLVREVVDRAVAEGHRVVWGQCWDEAGTPPFWPWTQVVRQLRGVRAGVDLASLVLDGSDAADEVDRFVLFDAVAAELHRAAAAAPLVVVLDDLHRSDPPTLLLARFVLAHLRESPVLVVASCRLDEAEARSDLAPQLAALLADVDVHLLELTGLELDEVGELIGDGAAAVVVRAVTGGNPLFVEQVLRAGGVPAGGGSGSDGAGSDGPSQRSALVAALSARLERIDPAALDLVGALAVLGPSATARTTAEVLGSTVADTQPVVRRARRAGLVTTRGWRLSHPLVAEAVAGLLPGPRLADLHLAAARLVVGDGGSAAERAHHLCRAGTEHWRAAVEACGEAARVATGSFAHEDAVAHYERAEAVVAAHPEAPELAFEVSFALAGALERTRGRLPAEEAYLRAMDRARWTGDPVLVARAAARHGIAFYTDGSAHEARGSECREALAGLPGGDSALRVRLLANQAASHIGGDDSAAIADDAVAMARRVGDAEALGIALVAQQVTNLGPSTLRRRLGTSREIIALADRCGERDLGVRGRFLLTNALLEVGDVRRLDAELLAQDSDVSEIAEARFARHPLWFRCMRAMFDGRADEVEVLAERCLAIAEELQDPDGFGVYTGQLGVARWLQGRLMELEPVYVDLMRAEPHEPLWPAVVGWLWLGDGRPEAARGLLDRLPPPSEIPESMHTLLNLFTMADVAAAVGDDDLVAQLWEALLPYADRAVPIAMGAACFGVVARPLGLLALRLGRIDEGIAHLERAIAVAGRMGAQPWLVDAQLALVAALVDHGRSADPRLPRLLAEAAGSAERLGLEVFAPRLTSLQRRVLATSPPALHLGPEASPADPDPAGGSRAHVSVLGTFEVVAVDGSSPHWTSRKARSLLKILVARRGAPLAREALMDLLWPGEDPAALGNRLAVAVSAVRRALDPSRLLPVDALVRVRGGAVSLSHERVVVDVETFLQLGEVALEAHRRQEVDAGERLYAALAACRGDALPDEPYVDWADVLRSSTAAVHVGILRAIADRSTDAHDHLAASDAYRQLVELDPYDEPAHLGLVAALRSLGARGQARAAYDRYVRNMEELGVPAEPDPAAHPGR